MLFKKDDIYDLKYNDTKSEIIILKKANLNLTSFKNQYISFSFFREDIKLDRISYYYFRVLQPDSINNITFYPLDSNFENLCKPELKTNSCYFLLKNDYNELTHLQRIYELNDNANNYNKAIIKKNEDYYSINLNNINFEKYPENTNLKINNVNMSNYLIIKIKCKLNYKSFLTISSAFYETEPFIQIYSYKLIYLSKGKEINFRLDNKAQQYKLKIINNMNQKDKGEIRFKKDNVLKDNINNNYGKQISYPINKGINNQEFLCKNNSNIT